MLPPAASYLPNFINDAEETQLLNEIDRQPWLGDLKRRVQHYGYRYDYKARRVTQETYIGPLPDWLQVLAARLFDNGTFSAMPDQVIVNEYLPGQGIAAHIDCEPCFGETIASLSLGSPCEINFVNVNSKEAISRCLEPRSLLVLQDEARFGWTHGIPARKSDVIEGERVMRSRRVSLTLRTVVLSA